MNITDLVESAETRVQHELRKSAPPLPPAVVVTVWGAMGEALPTLQRLAAVAAPGDLAVAVHSTAPSDVAVDVVRSLGLRLWCALPYDPVAKELRTEGHAAAVRLARTYAERCAHHRPEVVELNGEAAWKHDAQTSMSDLARLATFTRLQLQDPLHRLLAGNLCLHHLPAQVLPGLHLPQGAVAPARSQHTVGTAHIGLLG